MSRQYRRSFPPPIIDEASSLPHLVSSQAERNASLPSIVPPRAMEFPSHDIPIPSLQNMSLSQPVEIKSLQNKALVSIEERLLALLQHSRDSPAAERRFESDFYTFCQFLPACKFDVDLLRMCHTFILFGHYVYVDQFLVSYFQCEVKVAQFKKDFVADGKKCLQLLCDMSVLFRERPFLFGRFANYFLCSHEEVTEFKTRHLKHVLKFVVAGFFDFASTFINWCYDSPDEARLFKIELLFKDLTIAILDTLAEKCVRRILKWFSPTDAEVTRLKSDLLKRNGDDDIFFRPLRRYFAQDDKITPLSFVKDIDRRYKCRTLSTIVGPPSLARVLNSWNFEDIHYASDDDDYCTTRYSSINSDTNGAEYELAVAELSDF